MRLVFFGSPEPAAEALQALVDAGHDVVAAYTRPPRPASRSKQPAPTPVETRSRGLKVPVETPKSLRDETVQAGLREAGADAFAVVAYGRLLPPEVLSIPELGVVNVHPSLLPSYRGPSPVAGAILDGATETGVTVMLLDEGMDTGPILAQSDPVRLDGTERAGELTVRLFEIGARMLPEVLERLAEGTITPRPQDESAATVTKLLKKSDGEVDWSSPAAIIERMVRAYDPWPGVFTYWQGRNLKLLETGVGDDAGENGPGRVSSPDQDTLAVSTGEGQLIVRRLQLEGRVPVTAAEFLRGHREIVGETLPY